MHDCGFELVSYRVNKTIWRCALDEETELFDFIVEHDSAFNAL